MSQPVAILFIDFDHSRRATRVGLLEAAGYEVTLRDDWLEAEQIDDEGRFHLVLIAIHRGDLKAAADYSDRLAKRNPTLPILLLTDAGVFAPKGTLSRTVQAGEPAEWIEEIASMLAGSSHIREIDLEDGDVM